MANEGSFDARALFEAVDAVRAGRCLNWMKVAEEAQVSAITLTRLAQGARPDVVSLAALAAWVGLDVNAFAVHAKEHHQAEALAMISTYLRADRELTAMAAGAADIVARADYHVVHGR